MAVITPARPPRLGRLLPLAAAGTAGALAAALLLGPAGPGPSSTPLVDGIQGAAPVVDASAVQVQSAAYTTAVRAAAAAKPKVTVIAFAPAWLFTGMEMVSLTESGR